MKKTILILAAGLALAGCAKVGELEGDGSQLMDKPISFSIVKKNMLKSDTALNATGHYNFGVFAYKSTDATHEIMYNYLVGYNDGNAGVGYYMTSSSQTTLGDAVGSANGTSSWAYEGLGSSQYSYSGTDGYYTAADTKYMSNVPEQYLRYWDKAAPTTSFYAYAPYINGSSTVSFANGLMTFPNTVIKAGYDDASLYEFMYAGTTVPVTQYGNDVLLGFKRLNAKVNIKFKEDVEGYDVKILDLSSTDEGVQAAASIRSGAGTTADPYTYAAGSYNNKSGAIVDFTTAAPTVTAVAGETYDNTVPLVFAAPTDTLKGTTTEISSATTYYAVPKDDESGFTFHISYKLISTTGETIIVNNATVYVPGNYCDWQANKAYTYVFRITKNSNGTTDPTTTIDPTDPSVSTVNALFPIVFDGCTVENWDVVSDSTYAVN